MQNVKIRNLFWKDSFNIVTLSTGFLINLLIWLVLFLKISPQNAPIVLHYNIYFGIDFLDSWYKIYFIPVLGLIFIILNLVIGFIIYKQEKLASQILTTASLFLQVLLAIACICLLMAQ